MSNQYRSILKATSIFGGAQIIQILVGLLRSKLVAVLVGTEGMGLNSMYMSSLTMFITIFGMGVNMSVVKDLSKAFDQQNQELFAKIATTFRHLLWLLGSVGTIFVIIISPLISKWSFGNDDYVLQFCFLSLIVLFTLLAQGNTAVIISSRRIKDMAKCSLLSSVVSLLIAVPFFYFLRIEGIVPGIVFSTIGNYFVTFFYARKVKIMRVDISLKEQMQLSKSFVLLGIALVIASLLGNVSSYVINLSITRLGGLSDLGLYGAGFTITIQTITMVFASMGSDYFPRLSAAMGDKERMNQTMNEQSEIVLLLAVPILSVFMLFSPLIIRLLLSEEFLPITDFIRILCLGMLFKATGYALGYASFAKGDKKVYLFLEGIYGNLLNIILSVSFYYFGGLQGLAWSFVINYLQYYFVVKYVDGHRYGYKQTDSVSKLVFVSALVMTLLLALSYLKNEILYYTVAGVVTSVLCWLYLSNLNKKTGLLQTIKSRLIK